MERRLVLAIVLMLAVFIIPSVLWPPKPVPRKPAAATDTAAARSAQPESGAAPAPAPARPAGRPSDAIAPAETVWVSSPLYRFGFSTRGAQLIAAELKEYKSFAAGDAGAPVQLVRSGSPLLAGRLSIGGDTLGLDSLAFTPSATSVTVTGEGTTLSFTSAGGAITIAYRFVPDDYHVVVEGRVGGHSQGGMLALSLGDGLRSVEADSAIDYREYAVVTKADKTEKTRFSSIDPGQRQILDGPFEWVGVKSRYFFAAALAIADSNERFAGAILTGGPRPGKIATTTQVTVTLPVSALGAFHYELYAGPFEHRRLSALGHGLDDANPYGWSIFRPIIHPVSLLVVQVLFWMHERLSLGYGWVLIIFGVLVRLALWPLQQKAMVSQMRFQAAQPLLKDVQDRHKNDPQRLQQETLRLYKEHNLNPIGGCLPMLLPMPVLFALFFVFTTSIEFRGVPFLWLPDLSRHDPYFIIPILMGLSMYAVSKLGQIGMPKNPQMQTMTYLMPAMMTFLFLRFASGLNLYYAVQNLVSIPQQWIIAQRRLRQQGKSPGT